MGILLAARHSSRIGYISPYAGIYAASDATVYGDGTFYSPMRLQVALNNATPGVTIWLRGGTYTGSVTTDLTVHGTSSQKITVRSYPGEWAVLDGNSSTQIPVTIEKNYWVLRDLEITNSNTSRSRVLDASIPYDSEWRPTGLLWNGDFGEQLNLLIHDNGNGVAWFAQAAGGLSYGGILWNNGWAGSSNMRGHGHNWYSQNSHSNNAPKIIKHSISTNSGASTCKLGAQNGNVDDYIVDGCVLANSGAPCAMTSLFSSDYRVQGVLHGSGAEQAVNLTINNTSAYEIGGSVGGGVGTNYASILACSGLIMTNNYFSTGAVDGVLNVNSWTDATIQNNIAHGNGSGPGNEILGFAKTLLPTGTWDNNAYYSTNATYSFNYAGHTGQVDFSGWKSGTGYDTNSTHTVGSNPPDVVKITNNEYEIGRSQVAIYNWSQQPTVEIDLSGTNLNVGEHYYIFNAMNPLAGPIANGVYSGGTVTVAMDPTSIGGPASPAGDLPAGAQTAPLFATLVVRKYSSMQIAPVV